MAVALVLLAAGASRRMAPLGHKLLLPYRTWQNLQDHAPLPVPAALAALPQYKAAPPLCLFSLATLMALAAMPSTFACAVLDPQGPAVLRNLCDTFCATGLPALHIVDAPPASSQSGGQTASLQAGLTFAQQYAKAQNISLEGALVLLADMPSLRPALAFSVLNQFQHNVAAKSPVSCVAPAFGNKHGHPVAVHAAFFPAIMGLKAEEKLWSTLAPTCQLLQQETPECLFDIDTPAAYAGKGITAQEEG